MPLESRDKPNRHVLDIEKKIDHLLGLERKLSQAEIAAAIDLIPGAGWKGAQAIELRLRREEASVVRRESLLFLELLTEEGTDWPTDEYWTFRALILLARSPIPPPIAAFVIGHFRKLTRNREMMAEALYAIGTEDAAVALIEAMLEKPDEARYLNRSYAVERAADRGLWTVEFRTLMSGFLAQLVEKQGAAGLGLSAAADLWALMDSERATERLTRPPFWSVQFDSLAALLRLLKDNAARVAEERLWQLLDELKQVILPNNQSQYRRADVIWLLSRIRSSKVRPWIEELKSSPDTLETGLACEAAIIGIVAPKKAVHRFLESPGYHRSPAPIRQHWAVMWLGTEISNGGIHQYFFNSSGDIWPDALEGLKEMGLCESAAAFQTALNIFGIHGPSVQRTERWVQLQRLSKSDEEQLHQHGSKVLDHMDGVSSWPFIMRHAEVFRTEPPPLPTL